MSIKTALAGGGGILAAGMAAIGILVGSLTQPTEQIPVVSSPSGYICPVDWVRTEGVDPESKQDLVSCTDGRYIITARENGQPVAFDTLEGRFLELAEIPTR